MQHVCFSSVPVSFYLLSSSCPFTFPAAEYADIFYVYGFCGGNAVHDVAEQQRRLPKRRAPTRRVITGVYRPLRDTGTLPGFVLQLRVTLFDMSICKNTLFIW